MLQIGDNPHALRDLPAYIKRTYQLDRRWQWQELSRDMEVVIRCTNRNVSLIRELGRDLNRMVVLSDLDTRNMISIDCYYHILTSCRKVRPQSITVDAKFNGSLWSLKFNHSDGEAHIPSIIIGPRGTLSAVVRNDWWNGNI